MGIDKPWPIEEPINNTNIEKQQDEASVEKLRRMILELQNRNTELEKENAELKEQNKELEKKAIFNGLTGVYKRDFLEDFLRQKLTAIEERIEKERRKEEIKNTFSLIMFDIDHFKKFNDTYGHDVGDRVLVEVARVVGNSKRETDILARWGGEEFIIALPGAGKEEAAQIAERVRKAVENLTVKSGEHDLKVTISLGVTEFNEEEKKQIESLIVSPQESQAVNPEEQKIKKKGARDELIKKIFKRVDNALYGAKREGRNKVIVSEALTQQNE